MKDNVKMDAAMLLNGMANKIKETGSNDDFLVCAKKDNGIFLNGSFDINFLMNIIPELIKAMKGDMEEEHIPPVVGYSFMRTVVYGVFGRENDTVDEPLKSLEKLDKMLDDANDANKEEE